jgi:putative NIF3 family GTP cyclohydrolase 1 type 2
MKTLSRMYFVLFMLVVSAAPMASHGAITAREIVERIQKNVTCEWAKDTVDTFKAGNPDDPVTGVAVVCMPTLSALQQAADSGCNFIIAHEPIFYNHKDEISDLENDPVLKTKRDFIRDHRLIVWRFHDHIHNTNPDGVIRGMVEEFGWESYQKKDDPVIFTIPSLSVQELAVALSKKLGASGLRIVGDPGLKSGKVGLSVGAPSSLSQIAMLQRPDVEILIAGESREWETVEYVRDAAAAHLPKAMILLGHCVSEEAGMKYCAKWLKTFIGEVPITFIPVGEPFLRP